MKRDDRKWTTGIGRTPRNIMSEISETTACFEMLDKSYELIAQFMKES